MFPDNLTVAYKSSLDNYYRDLIMLLTELERFVEEDIVMMMFHAI